MLPVKLIGHFLFYRLITLYQMVEHLLSDLSQEKKRRPFRFSYFFLFDRMIFLPSSVQKIHCRRCNGFWSSDYCISRNHWSNKSQSNQYRCYPIAYFRIEKRCFRWNSIQNSFIFKLEARNLTASSCCLIINESQVINPGLLSLANESKGAKWQEQA